MPKPRIDLTKVLSLDASGMKRRMRRMALVALSHVRATAARKLNTSLAAYNNGLRVGTVTETTSEVELVGTVPNLVEQGMGAGGIGTTGAYDMRTFMLKAGTKSMRTSKDGHKYLHVPFGFTSTQVEARGGAAALRDARSLLPTLSGVGSGTIWGGRIPTGQLAGLVRVAKTYARATHSGFRMWRTMSERPDASRSGAFMSWLSPGVAARKIFAEALSSLGDKLGGVA